MLAIHRLFLASRCPCSNPDRPNQDNALEPTEPVHRKDGRKTRDHPSDMELQVQPLSHLSTATIRQPLRRQTASHRAIRRLALQLRLRDMPCGKPYYRSQACPLKARKACRATRDDCRQPFAGQRDIFNKE